jgi:two-component system secretion response regulator SsrB
MPPRIVIVVSADRLYAEAVASFLDERDGWSVAFVATDGLHTLEAVRRLQPSAVLILGDPARIGAGPLSHQLVRRVSGLNVVLVGDMNDGSSQPLAADSAAETVLAALADAPSPAYHIEQPAEDEGMARLSSLTVRERRILRLVASGASVREVSQGLKVSEHTVRTHVQNLYAKLGVHSRVQLIRFAARYGLSVRNPDKAQMRRL